MQETLEVSKMGLPFIEISLDDPETVSPVIPQLLEIKKTCGISFLAHYPNEDNPFDVEILRTKFLPRIKTLMNLSRRLDIQKATLHFWMDKRWVSTDIIRGKVQILSLIVQNGTDCGITVCIENLSERADSFSPAFDAIPDLRMTLDIGHAQLLASRNTSFRFIEELFPRIAHVHAHDNHGGVTVKDDLHLPLGEGSVNYQDIMKSLIEKGYESTISLEVKTQDMLKSKQTLKDCINAINAK